MKEFEKTVYNAIKNGTYTTFDTLKDSYVHLYEEIELLQAENARLTEQLENAVVLPCKVGDTVYWLYTEGATGWSNAIKKCQVSKISISSHYTEIHSERTSLNDMNLWGIMGKDVFLLESEAEARLAELKEIEKC